MLVFTVINLKRYHAPYFNYLLLGTNKFDVKNNLKVKIKLCSSVIHRSTRSHCSNLSYRPSLLSCYSRVARARVDVARRASARRRGVCRAARRCAPVSLFVAHLRITVRAVLRYPHVIESGRSGGPPDAEQVVGQMERFVVTRGEVIVANAQVLEHANLLVGRGRSPFSCWMYW